MGLSENNKPKPHSFVLKSFGLITLFVSLTGYATEQQIQQHVHAFIQSQYKDHFPELVSDDEIGRLKRFYEHSDGRDPRCCPSKKITLRYRIYNSDLVKL